VDVVVSEAPVGSPLRNDRPLGEATGSASRSHARPLLFLILLCLILFLPGIARIPAVDADEGRFVQATRQMVETGNYIDIRLQDEARSQKPIGIYWLQSAAIFLTGQGADAPIWAYRLPSLLGAIGAVLLTYWTTLPLFGRRAAFVAGGLMAVSAVLIVEAHLAKTDAALLATVVAAEGALARLYMRGEGEAVPPGLALVFWVALGAGILVKGPVIVMIVGLTVLALLAIERRAGWLRGLRPLIGVPIVVLMVAPWLGATLARSGSGFLQDSVGTDLFGKIIGGQESHAAPPGTHTLLFWTVFWPGSILAILALPWIWRNRGERAVRFCLAWIFPSLVVFELAVTKLPHYTMPLLPAAAALVGAAVTGGGLARGVWTRWLAGANALIPLVLSLGPVALFLRVEGTPPLGASIAAALGAALALMAIVSAARGRTGESFRLIVASLAAVVTLIFGGLVPNAERLWPARAMAEALPSIASCPEPSVAVAGFLEASAPFELGTETALGAGPAAATFLGAGGCRVAFVDFREEPAFLARAAELGLRPVAGPTISGLDLTLFRRVRLTAYQLQGGN
jgi:4-amino-4-deoxy-L-arabinose transferase-like glycosyltransferase